MKKLLITIGTVAVAVMLFVGGAYAHQYLTFTGEEQAIETNNNSSEMLEILKSVAEERDVTKEELSEALEQANELVKRNEELEAMNPAGLAKLNKELREDNEQLKNTNAQLTTDLNAKQKQLDEAINDKDEIARLEAELIKANETMKAVNEQSNSDVEEARKYR